MYFPDDRCCDRSGTHGAALLSRDFARGKRLTEVLPFPLFQDITGSHPCGGFLHPAAALLQRVLHDRPSEVPGRGSHRLLETLDDAFTSRSR